MVPPGENVDSVTIIIIISVIMVVGINIIIIIRGSGAIT
jgi:hypothetical protein